MTTTDLKNEIIVELLSANKISLEETINYEKFKELYLNYNYLPEFYFASIIGINYINYRGFKAGANNAVVLKNIDKSLFERQIINKLYKEKLIKNNLRINYIQFLDILKHVPFLSENALANILKIPQSRLENLRYCPNSSTIILKKFEITEEEETIIQELLEKRIIYPGMQITYEHFKKIHSLYSDINEYRFAYVLEMKSSIFSNMKKGIVKPVVLKSRICSFIECQKDDIIDELIKNRKATLGEKINYNRFLELYCGFEYISDVNFADIILGVNYNNFRSLKSNNKNAIILKERISLTDDRRVSVFHYLMKCFNLNEGDLIDYECFCSMCFEYKNILTENDIREILGIGSSRFYSLKYNHSRVRIINGIVHEKSYFIGKEIPECRFYSKEEIDGILAKYNITINEFIVHIVNKGTFFEIQDYLKIYEKNQGIFIGKVPIEKDFFDMEYNNISKKLKDIWYSLLLINVEKEDVFQEIMIYIYQKCGDLYYNFGNSEIFYNKVKSRVKKYIAGKLIDNRKKEVKKIYLSNLDNEIPLNRRKEFQDKNSNTEEEAMELMLEDNLYEEVLSLIENGASLEECLNYMEKAPNIKESELYQKIKEKVMIDKTNI